MHPQRPRTTGAWGPLQAGPVSWTPLQPTYVCAKAHKEQGRKISPSQGGGRADERGRHCCSAWDLPSQGPGTHLGPVFQPPSLFRCSTAGSFAAVDRSPLHNHNRGDLNYYGLSLRLSLHLLSALLHGTDASIRIFGGKSPRSGSLSPFARWLGSNTHTWRVEGWADASWPEDIGICRGIASVRLGDSRIRCCYK